VTERIAAILPTYNRAAALRQNLPSMLEMQGIGELVVVVDVGTNDKTHRLLTAIDDRKLVILAKQGRHGQAGSKNEAARATDTDWVLILEDDCQYPEDYAIALLAEAKLSGADIVGAPWLHVPQERPPHSSPKRSALDLLDSPQALPGASVETPFLPACYLVRRDVLDAIQFDESYTGNAYREETDFVVRAVRHGFKAVLTSRTCFRQAGQWEGGARLPRLRYEWSTLINNWRFLQRNGDWLAAQGYIRSKIGYQTRFAVGRESKIVMGAVRARAGRLIWRTHAS
jgi:GT2 family glycosyltransferase